MHPVFLTGTGRSGTTVLRRAFAHHPDVATMPGELRIIIDPGGVLDVRDALSRTWGPYRADAEVARFLTLLDAVQGGGDRHTPYRGHALDSWLDVPVPEAPQPQALTGRAWFRDRIARLLYEMGVQEVSGTWTGMMPRRRTMYEFPPRDQATPLRDFVIDLYRRRNPDATHFVEDTPYTALRWPEVRSLWPDAVCLFCLRDPRDILASFLHGGKHWTPDDPRVAARRISAVFQLSMERTWPTSSVPPDVLSVWGSDPKPSTPGGVIRLEDVLEDPEGVLADACRSAGLDPGPAMTMAEAYDPDAAHVGRWRSELTDDEWKAAEPHLRWILDGWYDGG